MIAAENTRATARRVRRTTVPVHDIRRPGPYGFELWTADALAVAARPHRHRFYEIVWVRAGEGTHVVDVESHPIQPATCWFIAPGQVHYWQHPVGVDGSWLLFGEEFLSGGDGPRRGGPGQRGPGASAGDDGTGRELFAALSATPGVTLGPAAADRVGALVDAIEHEHRAQSAMHLSVIRAYLHVLLVTCARRQEPPGRPVGRPGLLADQFTRLVAERAPEVRAVSDYAQRLGVTPGHLADTVRQVTGRTPGEVIRSQLAGEAKRLLAHSDLSVSEIAHRLRFDDAAYFCRFFRREAGASPGSFRRRFRAGPTASAA